MASTKSGKPRLIVTSFFAGLLLLTSCGADPDLGDPATVNRIQSEAIDFDSLTPTADCVWQTSSGQPYTGWVGNGPTNLAYLEDGRFIRTLRHSNGVRTDEYSTVWIGNRIVQFWNWKDGQEASGPRGEGECVDGELR